MAIALRSLYMTVTPGSPISIRKNLLLQSAIGTTIWWRISGLSILQSTYSKAAKQKCIAGYNSNDVQSTRTRRKLTFSEAQLEQNLSQIASCSTIP